MDDSPTDSGVDQSSSDSQDESLLDPTTNNESADEQTDVSGGSTPDAGQEPTSDEPDENQPTSDEGDSSETDSDESLARFAKAQGIEDFSGLSDREKRLLKVAHDNQRDTRKELQQRSDALRETTDTVHSPDEESEEDPIMVELNRVRANQRVTDFYLRNPEAVEYDKDMSDIVAEEAEKRGRESAQYLASDLDRLLVLAKARKGENSQEVAREAGRREERDLLRKKNAASADASQATSNNRGTKKLSKESILEMDDAEYAKLRESGELDEAIQRGDLY